MNRKAVLFCVAVVLAVAGYFTFRPSKQAAVASKPTIERVVPSAYYYDYEHSVPTVLYIDRRAAGREVTYVDLEQNGTVDQIETHSADGDKKLLMTYKVVHEQEDAEQSNRNHLFDGRFDIAEVAYDEQSREADILNSHYHEVREAYLKLHPGLKLPENEPFKPTINQAKIDKFLKLLAVHAIEQRREETTPDGLTNEVAQLRSYLAFLLMRDAFYDMSRFEQRRAVFQAGDTPKGMKISPGPALTEILGMPLTGGCNQTRSFREYLNDSYMETDYMSAWSISTNGMEQKVVKQFYREMEAKGLKDPEKPKA